MGLVSYIGTTPVGLSVRDTIKWALPKVFTPVGIHHCGDEVYEGLATYRLYHQGSNGRRGSSVLEDGSARCQLLAIVLSESTNKRVARIGHRFRHWNHTRRRVLHTLYDQVGPYSYHRKGILRDAQDLPGTSEISGGRPSDQLRRGELRFSPPC